jgi:hemerythrin superfamily protein
MPTRIQFDACELLDADHIATKHLFVEYARLAFAGAGTEAGATPQGGRSRSRSRAADQRPALARKICSDLTVHAQLEEEIFYPELRAAIDNPELLDEAQAEHQQAKELIAQIEGLPDGDAATDGLVSQLARVVEQHVKEERDVLFPKARAAKGLDLPALGAKMQERQEALQAAVAA